MKRRSRRGASIKPQRRKAASLKRPGGATAARPRRSSGQESEAARLASELSAMTEILRLISTSPGNVETVLWSLAEQAAQICQARYVDIFIVENDNLRKVAWFGEIERTLSFPLDRSSASGRSICDMRPVSVDDMQNAGDEFTSGQEIARRDGRRSIVAVPLTHEGRALGTIVVSRTEVRPFERKHIDLLTRFAAQAVIAIENARLLDELRQRTTDLTESLEQQTATSEVLSVISSSPGRLESVFRSMLENAVRICQAKFGFMLRYDGEAYHTVAELCDVPAYVEEMRRNPLRPHPESALGRVASTKVFAQISDITAHRLYAERNPIFVAGAELGGMRTIAAVPMLKDQQLIGAITIFRKEVRPFTDKQIALLQNFAAQAVIAIENTRLLNELRERTDDLTESLEQQTATSEVLGVISSSRGELDSVFQIILENATRICEANFGILQLLDGEMVRVAAMHNVPAAFIELRQRKPLLRASPESAIGRAIATRRLVHMPDYAADAAYSKRDPAAVNLVELAGARSLIIVPMLKDDELIGTISIYRQEVRPFTDKQIELVKNFANQAVIAIENTRLLKELRERTEQLETRSQEIAKLNQQLEQRVVDQVGEIERMSKLRRFLPPQVADLIVASGTEKQLESHRREITALFCDLRGFTGFSESSDPEDVMALLREYHAAIGRIIIKYSGTLERYAGDGVMVVFNDPVPVENPALQAVLMALEMREAIAALIEKWRDLGHDLGFGIGIAHGFATLGTIGFEGRFDYAAIGTVSNVASRLCDEAKPGQILVSPRVRQAVEEAVTVEPVGEFALKGLRRPMMTFNVLEASPFKPG
jgi:class 3 adenylate cyclase/putative methionine-R-sulfoxide reductase with GAF domain